MLDETDKKIIDALMDNSRLSYRMIAKKLNLSAATIMNRVRGLESEKLIKGYTVRIDYEKAGYDIDVFIEVKIAKGNLFEVEKKIAKYPNVSAVYDITGDFDAVILARFPNRRKMDNFLKKLQTFEYIERTNTKLILNIIKEEQIGTGGL